MWVTSTPKAALKRMQLTCEAEPAPQDFAASMACSRGSQLRGPPVLWQACESWVSYPASLLSRAAPVEHTGDAKRRDHRTAAGPACSSVLTSKPAPAFCRGDV